MKNITEQKTLEDVAQIQFTVRKWSDGSYDCAINTQEAKDKNLTGYAQFFAKSFAGVVQEFQKQMINVIDTDGTLKSTWPVKKQK